MNTQINLQSWPYVYLTLGGNSITDDSFEEYKKYYLSLLVKCKNNNEKMILICNLDIPGDLPIKYIIKQAQFNKEIYKFNKEYVKAVCILCSNKSFKNILNLYFSVSRPAAPFKLCRSFNKINKFLLEKFNINFDSNIYNDSQKKDEKEEEEEEEEEEEKDYTENIDITMNSQEVETKYNDIII